MALQHPSPGAGAGVAKFVVDPHARAVLLDLSHHIAELLESAGSFRYVGLVQGSPPISLEPGVTPASITAPPACRSASHGSVPPCDNGAECMIGRGRNRAGGDWKESRRLFGVWATKNDGATETRISENRPGGSCLVMGVGSKGRIKEPSTEPNRNGRCVEIGYSGLRAGIKRS